MDLNAMALYVSVVENKSFSEASRRLNVPVSTISRKISDLESALGVRLLERSTRKLRVTELGLAYYECCRRGLEEFEAGLSLINDMQSEVSGTLRISIPPNLADVLISPLVCAFQTDYPRTVVKILVTERYVDLIEDGVDIAFRVGKLQDSSLIARRLLTYRHLLVASKEYLRINGEPKHPRELVKHRLLTFGGWQGALTWELYNNKKLHKTSINSALSINEMAGIQYAAEEHQGIANIPAIICAKALQKNSLVEVMPKWRFATTSLSVIYPSSRNSSRMVKLFMDYCTKHIEQQVSFTGV